jgi:hypothetical protein
MIWLIYQLDRKSGKRMYVTNIQGSGIGHYSGPNELKSAYKWDDLAEAQSTVEWLNDPETFYGLQTPHMIEERS